MMGEKHSWKRRGRKESDSEITYTMAIGNQTKNVFSQQTSVVVISFKSGLNNKSVPSIKIQKQEYNVQQHKAKVQGTNSKTSLDS